MLSASRPSTSGREPIQKLNNLINPFISKFSTLFLYLEVINYFFYLVDNINDKIDT